MKLRICTCLIAALPLASQVRFTSVDGGVKVDVDGKPFTEFHAGTDVGKPFLAPLRSAGGKIVTRHYPMEMVDGESRDHPHHRGLWFSYDDVNGIKFWENDPSYKKPNIGHIIVRDTKFKDGGKSGTLNMVADWKDSKGVIELVENRVMTFYADPKLRTIDFDITLTAPEKVVFGDTKEGAFAIRLADSMIEKKGGKMVSAEGKSGMTDIWGHKSKWVDYSGDVEGEKLGIAIMDYPSNPRAPTYWHSRDYGLFALNPFGQQAFDKNQQESHWTLEKGQSLRFRWRVVIHAGDAEAAHVADLYEKYAK
jgi:hypothetical protein